MKKKHEKAGPDEVIEIFFIFNYIMQVKNPLL